MIILMMPKAPTTITQKIPIGRKISNSSPTLKVKVHPNPIRVTKAITDDSEAE